MKPNHTNKNDIENYPYFIFARRAIFHHKHRGYSMKISVLELENLAKITNKCRYCGNELTYNIGIRTKKNWFDGPSLDRLNNEKEMRLDNIQIICGKCNVTKQDRTHEEFIDYCYKVSNNFVIVGKTLEV